MLIEFRKLVYYDMATYDAVKWHTMTKSKVPLNLAVQHFKIILDWLNSKQLLTTAGQNAINTIDRNFEFTSEMLTPLGNLLMSKMYQTWVKQVDYQHRPKMNILEKAYNYLKSKDLNGTNTVSNTMPINSENTKNLANIYNMLNELFDNYKNIL